MAGILLADDNAVIATNKALEATNAAAIATAKNNEIKNVSVGSTITAVPSTPANVTYNPLTGKFAIIPKGDKGDRGEAFQVNAIGLIANRDLYDTRVQGFSFLALDESQIYFKASEYFWRLDIRFSFFGKGDKGEIGDAGNGIVNILFTSTSDSSGLAGQSGGTDTYTITYTDSTTDTFVVYNGLDSDVQTVAGRTGDVVLTKRVT